MAAAEIRVGTASWTDHDPFYPPEYSRAAMKSARISYYAKYFSLVEVDSTFYSLQPARNFQMWAERTPEHFLFDVKAYGEMTWHHRQDNGELITPHADTFDRFRAMLEPIRTSGKLGSILFQFPPWFTFQEERLEYFETIREMLPDDGIVVEFRHRSWLENAHVDATRSALQEHHLAYCAVDEPQIGSGSVPPTVLITEPTFSMVRFHGRNTSTWYGRNLKSSRDRFDYLYSEEELQPWADRILRISERLEGGQVHVIANNNASNYGIVNAIDFQRLLGQRPGQGTPLPEGVQATLAMRNERQQR